jgi:hypothetical protein
VELKKGLKTIPVQVHFDYDNKIVLETDASSHVAARIPSQYDNQGILYPKSIVSNNHTLEEENYEIYDQ